MMERCAFCPEGGDYGIGDGVVCQECAGKIFRAYRRNKKFREATEHGVVGSASKEATFLQDIERRRA